MRLGLRTKLKKWIGKQQCVRALPAPLKQPLLFSDLQTKTLSRNNLYRYCDYYFDHFLPESFRDHRRYFSTGSRGFGEDAFHAMWFLLFQHFRPANVLEIGVYRGQTITLWKMLSRHFGFDCQVSCISPFSPSGDSVSQYGTAVDYHADVLQNHKNFDLPVPAICRAFSNDPAAVAFIQSRLWDMVYIDGNHDYDVACGDWENCSRHLAPGGIIILDDSALETDYRPPAFATAGHPGPSKLAREIDAAAFREIFSTGHNRVFQKLN